jgi:hypothetical protein
MVLKHSLYTRYSPSQQNAVPCNGTQVEPLFPAGQRNLESISLGGGGCGTTQTFPTFLQVKELPGRSSDTLTQTRREVPIGVEVTSDEQSEAKKSNGHDNSTRRGYKKCIQTSGL